MPDLLSDRQERDFNSSEVYIDYRTYMQMTISNKLGSTYTFHISRFFVLLTTMVAPVAKNDNCL